jgi:uncharacterized coiled-coil protein SlyX
MIEGSEANAERLEAQLADQATYSTRGDEVATLRNELDAARVLVAELTERWEALEEKKAASGSS